MPTEESAAIMAKMDMAAADAEQKLRDMIAQMPAEQKAGALAVCAWMKQNYMAAGYKRLSKSLIAVTK